MIILVDSNNRWGGLKSPFMFRYALGATFWNRSIVPFKQRNCLGKAVLDSGNELIQEAPQRSLDDMNIMP